MSGKSRAQQLREIVATYGPERAAAEAGIDQQDMAEWMAGRRISLPGYGMNDVARVVGFPLTADDDIAEKWGRGRLGRPAS